MRFRFVAYEAEQRGSSRTGRSDDLRPAAGCGGRKGLFRHLTGDRLSRLNHPIDHLQSIRVLGHLGGRQSQPTLFRGFTWFPG
jgi:hypothetical protein